MVVKLFLMPCATFFFFFLHIAFFLKSILMVNKMGHSLKCFKRKMLQPGQQERKAADVTMEKKKRWPA